MALSHVLSSPIADFTGTVTVFNSAGVTTTANATQIVRPSDWNSAHNEFKTLTGNTAGASTMSGTNLIYQGGNNVTLSANGQSLIFSAANQTVQTQGMVSLQGSTGAIVFSNSNGITFGGNASTITASHNGITSQSVQTQSIVQGISAGTQVGRTGDVVFSNSNGISFGMSGSSRVTASYTVPSVAGLISAVNVSAGTTSGNIAAVTFGDANGVSFGYNNGTVTASVNPGGGAAFSAGISGGNTSGDTGTVSNRIVFAGGNNVTVSGSTNAGGMTVTISGANAGGAQTGISGLIVSDTTYTSGSVSFSNANGITFGSSAGQAITINHALQYTSATSAITSNALHTSASRVINIVAATNSTGGGTASLSSNVSFSAANGVTFYTSAGGAIVGSVQTNYLTTARASTDAVGLATAQTNVTWTVNSNGISFNAGGYGGTGFTSTTTAGTAIVATNNTAGLSLAFPTIITNAISTARASTDAIGLNTAQTNVTWTVNSSGLSFNAGGYAGTTTGFAGANISGSMTHNTAGLNLSLSVAAPGGGGGVALSAGTQSVSTGTVAFANSNGITFGMSGSNQITASYNSTQFAGTGTTFAGANASASMTMNSAGLNLSFSVAAPGAAAEANAINMLGANTAGNTTATGSTIGWSGVNITLSGTNASQVVISAPATSSLVGVSGVGVSTNGSTISIYGGVGSFYANGQYIQGTTTQTVGQSTSIVFPFDLKEPENPGFIRMPHTISVASTSFASTANTTYSFNQQETHNLVLYTRGTGASSQSLLSMFSTSASVRMSINVQRNSTNNISVTHALTFPVSNGTSSLSFSYAATNSTDQVSTTHMTNLSGMKLWDTQLDTFLDGKVYWLAYGMSTTQTTQGTAGLSAARLLHSQVVLSQPNNTIGYFGQANAASVQWVPGHGSFSTAGGGTISAFPISAVSSSASHNLPYIQLMRIA